MNSNLKNPNISIEEKITHLANKQIIAVNNNRQVGFSKYNFKTCELIELEVNEIFQRQGIGSELFQKTMQDLKSHGCQEMHWMATGSSLPFYFRQGARDVFEHPTMGLTYMTMPLN